jgi:DNA-binding transcriptional LysR family regulator
VRSTPYISVGSRPRQVTGEPTSARARAAEAARAQPWLGVEFRHLGALAAVAREGSFRRAAESLGYVQSAISGQIAHLERVVGTQLVERSSGNAATTLSDAGRILLSHVEEILARFEAARIDVCALADGTDVTVKLGVVEGVGAPRLSAIMRAFAERFPNAPVRIHERADDEASFDGLAGGELDLLITELPLPDGPFDYELLERDAYVLVVAADSPLVRRANPPDTAQLADLQLLLPALTRSDNRLARGLHESGIHQGPSPRPTSLAALQALAGASLGVAVMPASAVDRDDPSTVAIDVPGVFPDRVIALVTHRERDYSAHVKGFIETAKAAFAEPS